MYGGSKASEAVVKSEGVGRGSVDNPIRSFCKSLVRRIHPRYPSTPPDQDDAATASAPIETCQPVQDAINRVTQQGTFDWGSFSAFEDGSIEVEIAGVKQWFQNFSELERGLRSRELG